MLRRILVSLSILFVSSISLFGYSENNQIVDVWVSCEGTVVTRTNVGKLELSRVEPNSPNCRGPKVTIPDESTSLDDNEVILEDETSTDDWFTVDEEINEEEETVESVVEDVILLDLAQTDIVNYRLERMRQNQIRYANAIRSVRMRNARSKESRTNAYLMKNDAVIVSGEARGWSEAQGILLSTDEGLENDIVADTTGRANGYIATKYLREANPSDLVRIRQADNAYWSDLAFVNAEKYLNVRAHPWHTAPIVTTVGNGFELYVISTVDDWSEVMTDDRSIRGYVKSKYLTITKSQRVEQEPLLR